MTYKLCKYSVPNDYPYFIVSYNKFRTIAWRNIAELFRCIKTKDKGTKKAVMSDVMNYYMAGERFDLKHRTYEFIVLLEFDDYNDIFDVFPEELI